MTYMAFDQLPEPGDRYKLDEVISTGACGKVYKARDSQLSDKLVAVKIQRYEGDLKVFIDEEYRILRDFSTHPNLPDFFGVYRKRKSSEPDEIWFILEYCEGGSAVEMVRRIIAANKRLSEEQIAFILRETARAVCHLHENNIIHRDVRGSNILITKNGEVKLCDFGLACGIRSEMGKRSTCIGSPSWMAPEIINNNIEDKSNQEAGGQPADESGEEGNYGSRADVWALGITAIEMGDGKAPFLDMHPTRVIFQIVRNPPPTLVRPSNWSNTFNDFISECLEKNPENRPFMAEVMEHPFFTEVLMESGSDSHMPTEIKSLLELAESIGEKERQAAALLDREETVIMRGFMKTFNSKAEKMYVEDLAGLDTINEGTVIEQLQNRVERGETYSFIGDVLLSLNSNDMPLEIDRNVHKRYICKSRSDNSPHIFSVADSAYQDMLHHEQPQHILLAGESYSGKTTNMRLAVQHLCILGEGYPGIDGRVMSAVKAVQCFTNAGTPINPDSTRCVTQMQVTYGKTGKLTGAIFWIYLLEKLRVSSTDMNQENFHIFYMFYDGMAAANKLRDFYLNTGRNYRYLRVQDGEVRTKLVYHRDDVRGNVERFNSFKQWMDICDINDDMLNVTYRTLAAILLLGEVRFVEGERFAEIENQDVVANIARLLVIDEKKFRWALVNYCVVKSGNAEKRQMTSDEARDARDVLASTLYNRLCDWMFNMINQKLAFGRAVFGDMYMVTVTDMFGFECFLRNRTEQLMINSLNEQLQYHYNQRMFCWEMLEQEEDQIPVTALHYYDNKVTVDHLMSKPHGLFYVIDDATKGRTGCDFIIEAINNLSSSHVQTVSDHEVSVAHFTGKITYDTRDFADKNRDFLGPEMFETLRSSEDNVIKVLFTNQLSKTGNLTVALDEKLKEKQAAVASGSSSSSSDEKKAKNKWTSALVAETVHKGKRLNTLSQGQYSQVHKMRTLSNVFRATCLEILKGLSVGGNSGNTHFVRCIRADLEYKPRGFQPEIVSQQLRALAIYDTAIARQKGYPQRISFQEFLRLYKFLAFDFDETVDVTKDNCRLLLIRLKMEGWAIGNSKVFLKYYNEEYLSRLYETQVKKIIKVQAMMRAFLAKKKMNEGSTYPSAKATKKGGGGPEEEEAALKIQRAYRGFSTRQKYGPLLNSKTGQIDPETTKFVKGYAKKWKSRSIFQVLLHYRAARFQDLVNFSQQVHLYNQKMIGVMKTSSMTLHMEKIDSKESNPELLGGILPAVRKLPFTLDDIPYFDTSYMCDPRNPQKGHYKEEDDWDAPLRRNRNVSSHITLASQSYHAYGQYHMIRRNSKGPAPKPPGMQPHTADIAYNDNPMNYGRVVPNPMVRENSWSKKRPAPQPMKQQNYNSGGGQQQINFNSHNIPYGGGGGNKSSGAPKVNPVREMQMIAQQNNNSEDGESPPFNFQGMLRKTNFNRDSMKRTISEGQVNISMSSYKSPKIADYDSKSSRNNLRKTNNYSNNDVVPENSIWQNESNNNGVFVTEEIRPGMVLEGYAVVI